MFRSRSVLLILCLNFLVLVVFHYLVLFHHNSRIHFGGRLKPHVNSAWCLFPLLVLYPLMGWLADTRYGRYRMIKAGVWVMWVASILSSTLAVLKFKFRHHDVGVFGALDMVFFTAMSLGLSFFQANIIQFGVDQLIDASSVEITSYVNWYTWTFFASEVVIDISQYCVSIDFHVLSTLVPPVFLTVALILMLLFSKYLVVEPATSSPLKLITDVLRYAAKNKYPRQRSAFTYWEDKPYSRIDLAKRKYGGPFTTEEVENVKVFFRILALISIMSALVGLGYNYVGLLPWIASFESNNATEVRKDTLTRLKSVAILDLGSLLVVLVIPVYEVVLFPLCSNCLLSFSSRKKFSAGIVCWVLVVVIHLILFAFSVRGQPLIDGTNKPCTLYFDDKTSSYVHYYLIPIPKVFECLGKIWLFGASLEFVCAQAPYSMKGLLFGMMFALSGIFAVVAYVGFLPFHIPFRSINWRATRMGCGFWFFVTYSGISVILSLCFVAINCTYKNRQRSDDLPSEHYFAEGYYDHSDPASAEPMIDTSS